MGTTLVEDQTVSGAMTYDGLFVGPTLQVNPGELLDVTIVNQLAISSSLHTHGLHVSPSGNSDNVFLEIGQGQSVDYQIAIPANHPQGLYWYHPHFHHLVDEQLFRGLSGMLVIGRPDGGFPELDGLRQRLLGLKPIEVDGEGSVVDPNLSNPSRAVFTVNGQVNPTIRIAPGELQVWNVANIQSAFYDLQLDGHTLYVVAEDGQPLTRPVAMDVLRMEPGKRFSVIVQGGDPGTYEFRTLGFDDGTRVWPARVLATLVTEGDPALPREIPSVLTPPANYFTDLRNEQVAVTRTALFGAGRFSFTINGQVFDPDTVVFQPQLNTVEEWVLSNNTLLSHPFHLHQDSFQVTALNGVPIDKENFQDTVNIPPRQGDQNGSVTIRIKFTDFTGKFVFHCHVTLHEDLGMMAVVEVVDGGPNPPPAGLGQRFLDYSAHSALHDPGGALLHAGLGSAVLPTGYESEANLGGTGASFAGHLVANHTADFSFFGGMAGSMLEVGPMQHNPG